MTFSPIEPRKDAILLLRRDSSSSRSSSHTNSATPTHSSPKAGSNARITNRDSAPLTPMPNSLPNGLLQPVDEEPNTPSSTIVEFGDLARGNVPSAAQLVESIHRSFHQSQENRSLYQRIAALQLTERELLAENQDLTRKLATLKQHHDRRARQWNEGIRRKEIEYEARMRELGELVLDLVSKHPQKLPNILSNEEITAWFDDQDTAWNRWARTFGHQDANRLSSGLHPLQLQELCEDVKGFVRMTDSGGLPPEILNGGKEALHTLLNGMLANFICEEIVASPMWVFAATSMGTLESPGIMPPRPLPALPGVGFRMDTNSFSEVAPLRPGPCPTPKSPQFPPPLITSLLPPSGNSASLLGLPVKSDMERLVHMLADAQDEESRVAAHHWRAQMMRLFADGGFSLKDAAAAGRNESRRTFVDSRLNFARKLKERFLGGSARFLLQDQDANGIEKLECTLTDMIDEALRFSCRLWTRVAPLHLHGWKDLGSKEVKAATPLVTLCHAQAEVEARNHHAGASKDKPSGSAENSEDQPIVMVVQPAVVTESVNLPGAKAGSSTDGVALVWLRARVMLAGPLSSHLSESTTAGVGSQPSSQPDAEPSHSTSSAAASATGSSSKPPTPQALEVLPPSTFKATADAPA
ncbi:446f4e34-0b4a-468d-9161-6d6270c663b2 [Thermothielavioides terrestris]|uniref:446f4e34-0b4a-468d-9161-6d6270c663b2 n=1 Tax=Thermothielavioides terrestris TaxID=2587410 RepID=A0A3S4ALK8_9PEZI|nr:446f4e34-0b4a-468d-9161-6d6270c663b2 [Thermothielavioides terrestris]